MNSALITIYLAAISLWLAIGYVAVHFIIKFW